MALGENVSVTLHRGLRTNQNAEAFCGGNGERISRQALACFIAVFRGTDDVNEVIEMTEREQIRFEVFRAVFGFAQ